MAYDLNPDELASYSNQRRAAMSQRASGLAQVDRNESLANQGYNQNWQSMTRRFDQMRRGLPGSYMRRGLGRSGIYEDGRNQFNAGKQDAFGQLSNQWAAQQAQFSGQRQYLMDNYTNSMLSIEDQDRMRRAQIAAQLTGAY